MKVGRLTEAVDRWATSDSASSDYRRTDSLLRYLAKNLFVDYEPQKGLNHEFMVRLENWVFNVSSDDERKLLFNLLPSIFYAGRSEFESLYRVAYNECLARWLIDATDLDFQDLKQTNKKLMETLGSVWICPVTDSMRINSFYHINDIKGNWDIRPEWKVLDKIGDKHKIETYCNKNNIDRLVLLEDFVGTGQQIEKAVKFAAGLSVFKDILLIPLIICPEGVVNLRNALSEFKHVTISPVLTLSENSFVRHNKENNEPAHCEQVRNLVNKLNNELMPAGKKLTKPFGHKNTGGLLVMYSNTPNNSLPIIHMESEKWVALFKRHSRNQ